MNRKSYFGSIVIAIAMSGAMLLSSCSHDEFYYSEEKVEQSVNEKYAIAFEKAFGKVGPNVDWGFSNNNTNTRAFTRAAGDDENFQPDISFPEDCDASYFLKENEIPGNAIEMPDYQVGAGAYYIDEDTKQVDSWSADCVIYVKGIVDMSDKKFDINIGTTIYLTEGATLKLSKTTAEDLKAKVYIAKDAKLETEDLLKMDSNSKVYNHGTIKAGSFELTASSILYNVGLLETGTTGSVIVNALNDRIVNDGTINTAEVVVNAGAVQNNNEWNVSGTTHINSNNSGWVNNGHWTTNDYVYIAGSSNVINNCFLEVENDFEMNISSVKGAFKIDAGGGVLTRNFIGGGYSAEGAVSGPYVIKMGSKAVFVVEETAQLEAGRYDFEGFGIFGPTSGEYAVFQAKNIVRDPYLESIQSHGAVTYGGNLYVSAETHFPQGLDSDGSGTYTPQPYIYGKKGFSIANNIYAEGFNSGKPNINIPESPCSPGFSGGNPLYRVIAEDLSASEAGDFDFNDVVFDVVKAENGETTLKLICAGGVLPLRVRGANEAEGVEIHSVFGETAPNAKGQYKMYNTGAGPTVPETTFTVKGTYTTPTEIKKIIIEVFKEGRWMELYATTGEAACKILVNDTFKPVKERKNIADENEKFTDYVQGQFVDDFWWK